MKIRGDFVSIGEINYNFLSNDIFLDFQDFEVLILKLF